MITIKPIVKKKPKLKQSIMHHYRRFRIGEKWVKFATDLVKIGLLLILVFQYIPLVLGVIISIVIAYYIIGFIDYKNKLSKYELTADFAEFNPILDLFEKVIDKKLKELLECLNWRDDTHQETLSHRD